jgi:phage shock protein PspC (stress-responsive transcriptional regulator)
MTTQGDPLDPGGAEPTREAPAGAQAMGGGGPAGGRGRGRFERSRTDRVLGGVAGGLARYFGVDPLLVRLAVAGLALLGGAGVVLYAAAWLLVPSEEQPAGAPGASGPTRSGWAIAGIVVLALVAAPFVIGGAFFAGSILVPLAVLAGFGLLTWWAVGGGWPRREPRAVAKAAGLGLVVLGALHVLFFSAGWIAAEGGDGWIAAFVIAAGVALVAGAVVRRARWLVLPALTVALAAGFVAAADLELDGGYGDREYRPGSVAAVADRYELAVGEMTVDLRDVELPPGDTRMRIDVGIGAAQLLVDRGVCVVTRADVGLGGVALFEREGGGVDVRWRDEPVARAGAPRLVLDAQVGLGAIEVAHDLATLGFDEDGIDEDWDWDDEDDRPRRVRDAEPVGNTACADGPGAAATP